MLERERRAADVPHSFVTAETALWSPGGHCIQNYLHPPGPSRKHPRVTLALCYYFLALARDFFPHAVEKGPVSWRSVPWTWGHLGPSSITLCYRGPLWVQLLTSKPHFPRLSVMPGRSLVGCAGAVASGALHGARPAHVASCASLCALPRGLKVGSQVAWGFWIPRPPSISIIHPHLLFPIFLVSPPSFERSGHLSPS